MKDKFNHSEILKIYPWIKPRTLIYWSERDLIQPDFTDASGRGSSRLYSYTNVIEIGIVSELLSHGIPFSHIKGIMDTPAIREMKEKKDFDIVIYDDHRMRKVRLKRPSVDQLLSAKDQLPAQPTDPVIVATIDTTVLTTVDRFLQNGGHRLIGYGREDVTSVVLINVKAIKDFVDRQLRGVK